MVKNNHFDPAPLHRLDEALRGQRFHRDDPATMEPYRRIAALYSRTEEATAVLSDLKSDRSQLFHGGFSTAMGLDTASRIDSIWEEAIYARIHPDDLAARHLLELQLFGLLKRLPPAERTRYHTRSIVRMADAAGRYRAVEHRTFYLASDAAGALHLALCLYSFAPTDHLPERFEGIIQNKATGAVIRSDATQAERLLTRREKEVLRAVGEGLASKQIALRLGISKHTVDRHRQNIMEKLRAGSAIEALRVARSIGALDADPAQAPA